jgi:succinate semialdehyde reductase|tara:strand:+ start:140 stop:1081 length:942 start_codon:yes stop_codon:yes gene_type:complete
MFKIIQPPVIMFGRHSARDYSLPQNCLVITSRGAITRGWLEYLKLDNYHIFDKVESNPSIETAESIISEFSNSNFSSIIGLGGGSSMDVAKFIANKMDKFKILIPTTFGSGSEVTRISVLKVNGKKKSFHDDSQIANIAIVDSHFIEDSPIEIIRNSAIDATAQCSEGFDSKSGNSFTKFLCNHAFNLLEEGIMKMDKEKIVMGSLISGLGFGNCSTTLGHALSYVFSNEGYSHGHALAFTTTVSHEFNNSQFYRRFKNLVNKLNFEPIHLTQNLEDAAEIILSDRKHLDYNPHPVSKNDIIDLLKKINSTDV